MKKKVLRFSSRLRLSLTLSLSLMLSLPSSAQSLYEENLKLGEMLQKSGCQMKSEQCYQKAISLASEHDDYELTNAKLHLVDLLKFSRPNEAYRLNGECEQGSTKNAKLWQKHLAMRAFISFRLNDKRAFDAANEAYLAFCQENDTLPTSYDRQLQAMSEALQGYYNQALGTLNDEDNAVLRHDIRMQIFNTMGDTNKLLEEQQRRADTVDSLISVMYNDNLNEVAVAATMTRAQQKAEQNSSRMVKMVLLLSIIIIIMLVIWIYMRKKNQKTLEEKNTQLLTALKLANETDEMKSEFVKRVSHEIRTPLNAITGFNDILNNNVIELPQEERSQLLARINENVRAITKIVDELLQVANAESVQEYDKSDTIFCNQFLSELIYHHNSETNANVELNYSSDVLNRFTIVTNKDTLQKIIDHLIDNAIKFTQQGTIELNCKHERGMVIITVTDTGVGIPADQQDHIFEQFAKADAFKQGIGLGLTVCHKLAQKLGGDLQLDKQYTGGARFILSLPVK